MYDRTIRRRRAVLALLVASSLILVTAYFGESASSPLHSVQRGIMSVVSPIQEGASRALKPFRDLFGWVGDTVSAKGDLEQARRERDAWQAKAISLQAQQRENRRLAGLLGLNDSPTDVDRYRPVTARVIGRNSQLWYVQLMIDKGTSSGIRADMPVVASDGSGDGAGLIGKVQTAGRGSAIIRLITDSEVSVPATNASGTADGVVTPRAGDPQDLILQYADKDAAISVGDPIVTAGTVSSRRDLASLYPHDIPIGQVTAIDDPGSETQEIHVKPYVDLRRVEFVRVLTRPATGSAG